MAVAAAVFAAVVLLGGGSDDREGDPAERAAMSEVPVPIGALPDDAVAVVGDVPVSLQEYERWYAASARADESAEGGASPDELKQQVMQFLLQSQWVRQEAERRGIEISAVELRRRFDRQKEEAFTEESEYGEFLRESGTTEQNVLYQVEIDALQDKLSQQVKARRPGLSAKAKQAALDDFTAEFRDYFRARTKCRAGYIVSECGNSPSEVPEATFTVDKPSPKEGEVERRSKPEVEVPSGAAPTGLEVRDITDGSGPAVKEGDELTVDYVGVTFSAGEEFDSSFGEGMGPFEFTVGEGSVIAGWDEGLAGMKVGGRRELVIPPDLAYGDSGRPPDIGPDETLVFVVDLLAID